MQDLFISYSPNDRKELVHPLIEMLKERDISVWYDLSEINFGDSVTDKISGGLQHARFGLIVISKEFAKNKWARQELNALYSKQVNLGKKYMLPLWYQIRIEEMYDLFPLLADYKAIQIEYPSPKLLSLAAIEIEKVVRQKASVLSIQTSTTTDEHPPHSRLRQLLSTGKIEESIQLLEHSYRLQPRKLDEITLLASQFTLAKQDLQKGLIGHEYFSSRTNRIILSLLELGCYP